MNRKLKQAEIDTMLLAAEEQCEREQSMEAMGRAIRLLMAHHENWNLLDVEKRLREIGASSHLIAKQAFRAPPGTVPLDLGHTRQTEFWLFIAASWWAAQRELKTIGADEEANWRNLLICGFLHGEPVQQVPWLVDMPPELPIPH